VVDDSLKVSNPDFNLSQSTVDAMENKGISALFPIQAAVMKPAMEGRDLIGRARTGSGKTLAFAIPIVEKINQMDRSQRGRAPLCLVLAPTRELAKQVEGEFHSVAPHLSMACFYGGVSIRDQERSIRRGLDVVVGTPGRVMDLIKNGGLRLDEAQFVVLDEADQMLAVGFCEDVEQILEGVPTQRQTLLFSATLPRWVSNITRRFLKDPVTVDTIGEQDTGRMSDTITSLACQVQPDARASVAVDLITVYGKGNKTIVFTQTKREADEVAANLGRQFACEALHGDISQDMREKTLKRFRSGRINVLVATDVAARGLDIPNVDLVMHYEIPQDPESFLHRSGRTGRAGRKGTAVTLLTPRDAGAFQQILRQTKARVDMVAPPSPEEVMRAASMQVAGRLDQVDPEVVKFFEPIAERLLQVQDPHHSLATSLAALSGYTEVPKPRSLITQQEGMQTLRVLARPGVLDAPGRVLGILGRTIPNVGDLVGRIRMLSHEGKEGAAFDIPADASRQFLDCAAQLAAGGITLDIPKTLPVEVTMPARGQRTGNGGSRNKRSSGRRTDRSGNWSRNDRSSSSSRNDRRDGWSRNDRSRGDRRDSSWGNKRRDTGYDRSRQSRRWSDFDNGW